MDTVVKNERIKKILNNDEYIHWLEQFTLKHPKFYNDSCLDFKQSNQNIQDISLLYAIIENYAKENYITVIPNVCGNYYVINHNNVNYEIGIMIGPETIYYCKRTNNNENCINFTDIQNNTPTSKKLIIDSKIKELTQIINDMVENHIDDHVILEVTEKAMQKTLRKEKRTL